VHFVANWFSLEQTPQELATPMRNLSAAARWLLLLPTLIHSTSTAPPEMQSSFLVRLFILVIALGFLRGIPAAPAQSTNTTPRLETPGALEHEAAETPPAAQTTLATLALQDKSWAVRKAAIFQLTNQALLRKVAGDLHRTTDDWCEALARMHLALKDPTISARIPGATSDMDYDVVNYPYFVRSGWHTATGEQITFTIRQNTKLLASSTWRPDFPFFLIRKSGFVSARVDLSDTMRQLFSQPEFTQADLPNLTQSRIPEVQAGALALLTVDTTLDQTLLATLAMGDGAATPREIAVEKLTDQVLLAEIAVEAPDPSVRIDAVKKLTNRTTLAKFANNDTDARVRNAAAQELTARRFSSGAPTDHNSLTGVSAGTVVNPNKPETAVERMTHQTLLVDIAKHASEVEARAAVQQLTNQALLADVAMSPLSGFNVWQDAVEKVTDQALLATIASKGGERGEAAIKKLTDQGAVMKVLGVVSEHYDADAAEAAEKRLRELTGSTSE
jgi:hypothetical protein